jgi:hypothetical protein
MAHLFATQSIVPVITSVIFDKNRNDRYVQPACSLFCSAALARPQWVGFVSLNYLRLFSLRKAVSACRLGSALTDSKLGSFRQNSLMPGLRFMCRPIEIGFVWSESLEVWIERHVASNGIWLRLARILIVDNTLLQAFTQS